MVKLGDCRFTSTVRIMSDDTYTAKDAEHEGSRLLREQLAEKLIKTKMEVLRKPLHTELRIELYCFTPDEFAMIVHEKAKDLAKLLH